MAELKLNIHYLDEAGAIATSEFSLIRNAKKNSLDEIFNDADNSDNYDLFCELLRNIPYFAQKVIVSNEEEGIKYYIHFSDFFIRGNATDNIAKNLDGLKNIYDNYRFKFESELDSGTTEIELSAFYAMTAKMEDGKVTKSDWTILGLNKSINFEYLLNLEEDPGAVDKLKSLISSNEQESVFSEIGYSDRIEIVIGKHWIKDEANSFVYQSLKRGFLNFKAPYIFSNTSSVIFGNITESGKTVYTGLTSEISSTVITDELTVSDGLSQDMFFYGLQYNVHIAYNPLSEESDYPKGYISDFILPNSANGITEIEFKENIQPLQECKWDESYELVSFTKDTEDGAEIPEEELYKFFTEELVANIRDYLINNEAQTSTYIIGYNYKKIVYEIILKYSSTKELIRIPDYDGKLQYTATTKFSDFDETMYHELEDLVKKALSDKKDIIFNGLDQSLDWIKKQTGTSCVLKAKESFYCYATFYGISGELISIVKTIWKNEVIPPYYLPYNYEFIKWDKDLSSIDDDMYVYALCLPTWEYLTSLCDNEAKLEELLTSTAMTSLLTASQIIKIRENLYSICSGYKLPDAPEVGGGNDGMTPFNPEGGDTNEEAAANSIINVKNLDITFKPKKFVDETKQYVQEKVMPYLTAMIPSTTIFSYRFSGETEDIILKTPKIVFYDADNDNLSSDNRVVIGDTTSMEIGFDAIIDDAKTYHIKVDSDPVDYTVNLSLSGDDTSWLSVKRDTYGDGFLISVTSDNFSLSGDTSARTINIIGTLETIKDDEYSGTAITNVNIKCTQSAYTYDRVYSSLPVKVLATQNDEKTKWAVSWTSEESIPSGNYIVNFYSNDEQVMSGATLSGTGGDFTITSSGDTLTMEDDKNTPWEKFTSSAYTVYTPSGKLTKVLSDTVFIIEDLAKSSMEYNDESNSFTISANTPWTAIAWRVDDETICQTYSGSSCGTYTIDKITSGTNTSGEDFRYIISASTEDGTLTDTVTFNKKCKETYNFTCTLSATTIPFPASGGDIHVSVIENDGKDEAIYSLYVTIYHGTESRYSQMVRIEASSYILKVTNIPANTSAIEKEWTVSIKIVDYDKESHIKTLTFIQNPSE